MKIAVAGTGYVGLSIATLLSQKNGCEVINNFDEFADEADIIIANRMEDCLEKVKEKIYTRDLYARD